MSFSEEITMMKPHTNHRLTFVMHA